MRQVFQYSFRVCTSKPALSCVQCPHPSFGSIRDSAPIANDVIVYGAIYRLVYDNIPGFSVSFDACIDNVYQAVLFSSPSKRPGDEANSQV